MKAKRLISLILAIALSFLALGLTACGKPDNGDEIPEGGGEGTQGGEENTGEGDTVMLELIKDKVAKFNIVSSQKDPAISAAINEWITALGKYGIEVSSVADYNKSKMQDCEILIGTDLAQRSEYAVDTHDFGTKGYVIKVQGEKVVISGGSTESTVEAMTLFLEEYLGINIATVDLTDVSIAKNLLLLKVQDDYLIKDVTVGGESIRDAYISATRANGGEFAAAQLLQAELYSKAGIWLDIKKPEVEEGKRISFNLVDDEGEGGFRVFVNDGVLTVNSEFDGTFDRGVTAFLADRISTAEGVVDFPADYTFTHDISFVRYSEFGAKGTGEVDDFDAIIETHEFANKYGLRVEADKGATYYIGASNRTAYIETDVDWTGATIIIDDRTLSRTAGGNTWVFKAVHTTPSYSVKVPEGMTLSKGAENIGLTFDTDVMLSVYDANKRLYMNSGFKTNGNVKKDILIVRPNGDVDPLTPPMFDFDTVTSITAQPLNDKPITITGGTVIQYPNHQPCNSGFFARGIDIERSNTTVYGLTFYFEQWPDQSQGGQSAPYDAFLIAQYSYNIRFDSCNVSGRRYYTGGSGTYGLGARDSIGVTWYNCTQINDIHDRTLWGIMGSNGSKNLTYEKCYLSRFDVHAGAYNVTLKDSTIGEILNFVGWGTAYLENVKVCANQPWFIRLREDFGGIWGGDVIIKNCELELKDNVTSAYILRADWTADWEYGYDVVLPNVTVDGFKVTHQNGSNFNGQLYVFKKISEVTRDLRYDEVNPLTAPAFVSLKGVNYNVSMVEGKYCEVVFTDTKFTHTKED